VRKLVVVAFMSLDGVVQAPGDPQEDLVDVEVDGPVDIGHRDEDGSILNSMTASHL